MKEMDNYCDVAVIGGGPAGITAAIELSKNKNLKVFLFEHEAELGGIPRSCHIFFGMRDLKRVCSGPSYAQKISDMAKKAPISVFTKSTVLKILPGDREKNHTIFVSSEQGCKSYRCKNIVLATGCFENSRESRRIPGARSAGVFTTGTLQDIVNIRKLKPGSRAIIVGSEMVALSSAITLSHANVKIAGMIEEDSEIKCSPLITKTMNVYYNIPIYTGTKIRRILGRERVRGVEIVSDKRGKLTIDCDTVICTGEFRPNASLIYNTAIMEDKKSLGPIVDNEYQTSIAGIFAVGNILHGAHMHDLCALEGLKAAKAILRKMNGKLKDEDVVELKSEDPIYCLVPQRVSLSTVKLHKSTIYTPGTAMQVSKTVKNCVIRAVSGENVLWEKRFRCLRGHKRIPIPIEKFKWGNVSNSEVILKLTA